MAMYCVQTDGFLADDIEADDINEAIERAFEGEGMGRINDVATLERKCAKYVADGGWCVIEEDGVEVLTIGR